MKKGQELELTIEKFADRGKSLVRKDGYVIFVAGAVPGDIVRVRLFKRRRKFAEGQILEIIKPSALRTPSRCRYFGTCGGCKWQHVEYTAQLEAKRQSVAEALHHEGGFEGVEVQPTLGAGSIYGYRNKMEFSFSAKRWLTSSEIASGEALDRNFAMGMHVPGRFDKVLDLEECHLMPAIGMDIVNGVREWVKAEGWTAWNVHKHTGFLRHLVLRMPAHTEELMVNLVTSTHAPDRMAGLSTYLQTHFPQITTFVNTINSGVAQTAFGEAIHTIYGAGTVHDKIGAYTFEIAPDAFFQTNTHQAERLYEVARDFAELQPDDLLYDLYSGAGTISLFMSSHVRKVVGVELIESAVQNARANALANKVTNCTFVTGDMKHLFTPDFIEQQGRPDVLIVDPPRAGMHPKVVKQIGRLRPERFVYVSCNPRSQAHDLALLKEVYTIEAVQPVDLFPHTHHVENVVKCRRIE